ncbi:hypothetical protein C8Q70DRAFT_745675 [Cubamyces menziesii]|nr:hypothetical protein C8Q70DRAFT_745675 [Cubamyces menziesii]
MLSCRRLAFTFVLHLATLFQLVRAAPAEKDVTSTFASTSSASSTNEPGESSAKTPDAQTTHAPTHRPGADGAGDATQTDISDRRSASAASTGKTSSHSILILPTPHSHSHPTWSYTPGHPLPITHHWQPNPPPSAIPHHNSSSDKSQPPVAIAFEVLGGIVALLVVLGFARCYISYLRAPRRDRIASVVDRHQLEREMAERQQEELEGLRRVLEARRWHPPPPPYQRAPDYEEVVRSDSPTSLG